MRARGSQLPQARLDEQAVRQMRADYAEAQQRIHDLRKRYSVKALAAEHGVGTDTIKKALSGATWGHVR